MGNYRQIVQVEWLRRLGVELLKESPNPALRSCWALAQAYNTLARLVYFTMHTIIPVLYFMSSCAFDENFLATDIF